MELRKQQIVKQLQRSLLGRPGIQSLHHIARINLVEEDKYVAMYPDLFKGLGTATGEYHINLHEGAKPFSLSTPRRVALPPMPKVKQELDRMEAMGVITRVEQPTDWCEHGLVNTLVITLLVNNFTF